MSTQATVRVWADDVQIPTYLVGQPNRNPMFLEKRVYQGSSGRVYPYPVIDKIGDEKVDERHRVVFLENEYLKLMIMPGFGGRIQYAYDKTNEYPFIYHNRVIKPALVGLAGPWLSGGIEFNWPQHHRPGTYCPVDYTITEEADGSATLWLSELEPMWHLKGTLGLTLYPNKAFLEINIRLFNPTSLPQSFHLWTNPAVHVNDCYQSVFPPDVQAVYDHGKRAVSAFPIARGEYYKVDYSRGVDISWYKNLPVPTSYMAARSGYDFIGGYDHGKQAGVLHVADHHFVPGKKQWVWGCGDFGRAWDRNLTDEDGPYAELMCGVFADNQPDFSWLQPFEEKETKQYFFPYKGIGYVRNATVEAAVSLELEKGAANIGAYATSPRPNAVVQLLYRGEAVWKKQVDLGPERCFNGQAVLPKNAKPEQLQLQVLSSSGEPLVSYVPEPKHAEAIPEPAQAIPPPAELPGTERLYLAGLHLEQYRHATREPEHYYREALRRDPEDIRNNNALGLLLLRRGQFAKAEPFFRAAIRSQTRHNPNPEDGQPHYNLGVCLRYLSRLPEACDAFYKAAWDAACQDGAFLHLAQLAALAGNFPQALDFAQRSLARNIRNQKALLLQTLLLRKSGRKDQAHHLAQSAVARDPLDFGARNELFLLGKEEEKLKLLEQMRGNAHSYLEIAHDYAQAGAYDDAIALLETWVEASSPSSAAREADALRARRAPGHLGETGMPNGRPMGFYFLGYYASLKGDEKATARYFETAAAQNPERCFPNSLPSILALQAALQRNPRDARACFYLGNLWYDKRQVPEAIACWERACRADPSFPTPYRNLALAYFNKRGKKAAALRALSQAFQAEPTDARVLLELDLLKKRLGVLPKKRLEFLLKHRDLVEQREDLLLELATLFNFFGKHQDALELLLARNFHPWEGGEGKVTGQYVVSLTEMAKQALGPACDLGLARFRRKTPVRSPATPAHNHAGTERAIELLQRARIYPRNLGEGKLDGAQENQIFYWLGVAHECLGDTAVAHQHWNQAAAGMTEPTPALYYNDQNPESIFYQGLALLKLRKGRAAKVRFESLLKFGQLHLKDKVVIDYFAVSLPEFLVFDDDLDQRNQINCRYLMALGYFGLGKLASAQTQLNQVLGLDPSHLPARLHLNLLTS